MFIATTLLTLLLSACSGEAKQEQAASVESVSVSVPASVDSVPAEAASAAASAMTEVASAANDAMKDMADKAASEVMASVPAAETTAAVASNTASAAQ